MFKLIKKSLIILLLITINVVVYITKIIYIFYKEHKSNIENYSKNILCILKEELNR